MSGKRDLFTNIYKSESPISIEVANSEKLQVEGIGKVTINLKNKKLNLEKVLYVPEIKKNLISIRNITENNYTIKFNKNHRTIKTSNNKIITFKRIGKLYMLENIENTEQLHQVNEKSNL